MQYKYKFEIKPKLEKKLKKIEKKDPVMFKAARDKMEEIIKNLRHYKPLRYDMKGLRRRWLDFLIWGIMMKFTGRNIDVAVLA